MGEDESRMSTKVISNTLKVLLAFFPRPFETSNTFPSVMFAQKVCTHHYTKGGEVSQ